MTLAPTILYSIALLSQVMVISFHLPARLVGTVVEDLAERDEHVGIARRFAIYLGMNRFTALLGLLPILSAWLADSGDSLTPILLATGIFFFIQMGALLVNHDIRNLFSGDLASRQQSSRPIVFVAVGFYIAYVAISLIYQNESSTSTWAKIQIVTIANAFFVTVLLPGLVKVRRAPFRDKPDLRRQNARSINVLATISVGLSIYFFGKDVLADLEVSMLRPFVMSVFLQGLALFVVPIDPRRETVSSAVNSTSPWHLWAMTPIRASRALFDKHADTSRDE